MGLQKGSARKYAREAPPAAIAGRPSPRISCGRARKAPAVGVDSGGAPPGFRRPAPQPPEDPTPRKATALPAQDPKAEAGGMSKFRFSPPPLKTFWEGVS